MGDRNCRLPRSHGKRTVRWCIHTRATAGGLELLEMMERLDLQAASTRFQPLRNHTNATYIPKDPRYNPLQLDYILTSSRWASSVRQSHVRWGVSIRRRGSSLRPWHCRMYVASAISDEATDSPNTRLCDAQTRPNRGSSIRCGVAARPGHRPHSDG